MKNRKKLFSLLLFFSMPFIFINETYAVSNVSIEGGYIPGTGGSFIKCGPSGNCYRNGSTGFRITIVDKNGNRCKYNQNTNTLCNNDPISDNVNQYTQSIDYWFDPNFLFIPNKGNSKYSFDCYANQSESWKGKHIKSEVVTNGVNTGEDNNICESEYKSVLGLTDSLGYSTSGFTGDGIETYNNPLNGPKFFDWLTQYSETNDSGQLQAINTILYNATYNRGNVTDITTVNNGDLDGIYLEFEQLASYYILQNADIIKLGVIGTVAEVTKMLETKVKNNSSYPDWYTYLYCYKDGGISGSCYDGTLKGWFGSYVEGFKSNILSEAKDWGAVDSETIDLKANLSSFTNVKNVFASKDSRNVSWFSLKTFGQGDSCQARLDALHALGISPDNAAYRVWVQFIRDDPRYSGDDYAMLDRYNYYTRFKDKTGGYAQCAPIPDEVPEDCNVEPSIDNCNTGQTWISDYGNGDVNNTEAWNQCTFNNIAYSSSRGSASSRELNLGDTTYCPTYCQETFQTTFPTSGDIKGTMRAGQTFFWGKGIPQGENAGIFGTIDVQRICKYKSNYDSWKNRYNNALYDLTYNDSVSKIWLHGANNPSLLNRWCSPKTEKSPARCYMSISGSGKIIQNDEQKTLQYNSGTMSCGSGLPSTCISKAKILSRQYLRWAMAAQTTLDELETKAKKCNLDKTEKYFYSDQGENQTESEIQSVIGREDKYASKVKVPYTMSTKVQLQYEDPISSDYNVVEDLVKNDKIVKWKNSVNFESDTQIFWTPTRCYWTTDSNGVPTSETMCSYSKSRVVLPWDNVTYSWNATYEYDYPKSLQWYSLKDDFSFVRKESDDGDDLDHFIGYGLPTSLLLHDGTYGTDTYGTGTDNLSVKVSNIGHNPSGVSHFNNLQSEFTYTCPFTIENDIFLTECEDNFSAEYCNPRNDTETYNYGLDIVYRVIDLANPFPGKSGGGRHPGSNWTMVDDLDSILATNIYDSTPEYTATLTPSAILKIRSSNDDYRDRGKDPYTSYKDANNRQKIHCYGENGTNCTSDYLDELISKGILKD